MNNFRTIHTDYGLQRMAQAEATGVPINLTHMAVGDGNGNPVTPSQSQTGLVREIFRAAVNRVYQDPEIPSKFYAEMVIPASVGGFVMRECCAIDDQGGMFVVGNTPDSYKPNISEGAYGDTILKMEFLVTNADVVNIFIDPNVAVASQTWVVNNVTVCSLLPGGTTGQVLKKKSNGCGDTEWADPDVADVVVDVIEETQTLAAAQTVVTLAVVTTRGIAVYIEGVRIPQGTDADSWRTDPSSPDTKIILGQAYSAGTRILLTQNEPTGSVPFPLIRDQNLADVPNKAAARENLGVYSKVDTDARGKQPGDVFYTARATAPARSLKANGAAVSRTAYAALFAAIGTRFGAGDGFNTFNLPDLRGEFLEGWDDGRGVDPGRVLGSWKNHSMATHHHGTGDFESESEDNWFAIVRNWAGVFTGRRVPGNANEKFTKQITGGSSGTRYTGTSDQIVTSGANRPRGVALLACIAY